MIIIIVLWLWLCIVIRLLINKNSLFPIDCGKNGLNVLCLNMYSIVFWNTEWFKERAGVEEEIDPSNDDRYTFINGRLIVHEPSQGEGDDGSYQCVATNEKGSVLSNTASLEFGCELKTTVSLYFFMKIHLFRFKRYMFVGQNIIVCRNNYVRLTPQIY